MYKKNYIITLCKDSICNDLKLILGSYVKGPNNKICRAWAERLDLGHWTVVGHGVHGNRTRVNLAYLIRFFPRYGLSGSGP